MNAHIGPDSQPPVTALLLKIKYNGLRDRQCVACDWVLSFAVYKVKGRVLFIYLFLNSLWWY